MAASKLVSRSRVKLLTTLLSAHALHVSRHSQYWVKRQQPREQHYILTPTDVYGIFESPNSGVAPSVWGVLTCAMMLMHETAHGEL